MIALLGQFSARMLFQPLVLQQVLATTELGTT
jgi:hypothetical protein